MLNVSIAQPTPSPRGTPASARPAGGDFKDTLGALSAAPIGDTPAIVPTIKVAMPGPCGVAPTTPETPNTNEVAAPTTPTVAEPVLMPAAAVSPETTSGPASLLPLLPSKRQVLADGGKPLPDDVGEDDPSKDVIWLPTLLQPVPALAAQPSASQQVAAPTVSAVQTAAAALANISAETGQAGSTSASTPPPAAAEGQSGDAIAPSLPPPNWTPPTAGRVASGDSESAVAKTDTATLILSTTAKPDLPVRFDNADAANTQSAPIQQAPIQPTPAILPAGQAFAAAIAAAVQQGRDEREAGEPHAPLALAATTLDRLHAPAVAATPDARQAALDLRQDSGLQGMIDHIEVLRDGANAGDTRIRLIPDALGAVDVSVRRDGERLHVHFNAETQASARLIADAQPRLAELADARGVKLGQTSVDSGDGQSRRQQPATPIQFTRPATTADSTETPDDLRVA